jgi:hypothetical protein
MEAPLVFIRHLRLLLHDRITIDLLGDKLMITTARKVDLFIRATPHEFVSRLSAEIHEEAPVFGFRVVQGSRPVVGYLTDKSLRLRKRILYRNGLQSFLMANIYSCDSGTHIIGKIGMHPLIKWFLLLYLIANVLFAFISLFYCYTTNIPIESNAWLWAIAPACQIGIIFLLITVGRYFAKNEGEYLLQFIKRIFPDQIANETELIGH